MGRKSGYKSEMMGHFNAIHQCVLARPEISELNKKKPYEPISIKKLKANPPNENIAPLSWKESVERIFEDTQYITQAELDEKISGIMAHAFNHTNKYTLENYNWHEDIPKNVQSKGTIVQSKNGNKYIIQGYDKKYNEWFGQKIDDKGNVSGPEVGMEASDSFITHFKNK